jgi:hypothetical protein
MRNINDVHQSWIHRVPPNKRQLQRDGGWRRHEPFVDVSGLGQVYATSRLVSLLLLVVLMAVVIAHLCAASTEM